MLLALTGCTGGELPEPVIVDSTPVATGPRYVPPTAKPSGTGEAPRLKPAVLPRPVGTGANNPGDDPQNTDQPEGVAAVTPTGDPAEITDPEGAATDPTSAAPPDTGPVFVETTNWPGFRGANGGVSTETDLPVEWGFGKNIAWKAKLFGGGASSPIAYENRIVLTGYKGYGLSESNPGKMTNLRRTIAVYDRKDGRLLWDWDSPPPEGESEYQGAITSHGYATSTPATDGEQIYAFYGKLGMFGFPLNPKNRGASKTLWKQPVGQNPGSMGSGSSPLVFEDLVIVNASVESGTLGALFKKDGKIAWQLTGLDESWSTPILVEAPGGRQELVLSTRSRIIGIDPWNGTELWNCSAGGDMSRTTVVAGNGFVYAVSGSGGGGGMAGGAAPPPAAGGPPGGASMGSQRGQLICIAVGGTDMVIPKWTAGTGSPATSPVFYNGYLFWVDEMGTVFCADPADGKILKRRRGESGQVFASLVAGDDKLYVVSKHRGVFVFSADPELEELAHNKMDPDESVFNGGLAISQGQIFLRSERFLYCIGDKDKAKVEVKDNDE